MAMLMGQLVAPLPVGSLLFDRGVETVIGAAIGTLLIVVPELVRRHRRTAARSRCKDPVTIEPTMQSARRS
jgi:hypothetical protein